MQNNGSVDGFLERLDTLRLFDFMHRFRLHPFAFDFSSVSAHPPVKVNSRKHTNDVNATSYCAHSECQ